MVEIMSVATPHCSEALTYVLACDCSLITGFVVSADIARNANTVRTVQLRRVKETDLSVHNNVKYRVGTLAQTYRIMCRR